jgi:hypothetical protein
MASTGAASMDARNSSVSAGESRYSVVGDWVFALGVNGTTMGRVTARRALRYRPCQNSQAGSSSKVSYRYSTVAPCDPLIGRFPSLAGCRSGRDGSTTALTPAWPLRPAGTRLADRMPCGNGGDPHATNTAKACYAAWRAGWRGAAWSTGALLAHRLTRGGWIHETRSR